MFRGLEHQLDGAGEGVLQLVEHIGRPQEHGGVGVVAAGVGHAGVQGGAG